MGYSPQPPSPSIKSEDSSKPETFDDDFIKTTNIVENWRPATNVVRIIVLNGKFSFQRPETLLLVIFILMRYTVIIIVKNYLLSIYFGVKRNYNANYKSS